MRLPAMLLRGLLLAALAVGAARAQPASVSVVVTPRLPTWSTGYNADVVITNFGSTTITGWTVAFDLPATTFSNIWNATEGASTATRKIFSNLSTNAKINPGSSRSFGFTAATAYAGPATNITFNGVVPAGNVPTLSIASLSLSEGEAERTITLAVVLNVAAAETVTVDWTTADLTAVAGSDYRAASGTLVFAPGVLRQTLSLVVVGDAVEEPDESFSVALSNPVGAPLAESARTATVTLTNDDFTPAFAVGSASVIEGDPADAGPGRQLVFTVTLAPAAAAEARVDYATEAGSALAGGDFTPVSGTLVFAPGETSRSVVVPVAADTVVEGIETLVLRLSAPAGALLRTALGVGTIYDNDGGGAGGKPRTGPFNAAEALQKSLLFYDAQRSGRLPDDFRVRWRGHSALTDGADVGLDLTGGFYDAGDHVKFGLPLASSLTLLAWGGVEYRAAYAETRQLSHLLDVLRWGADYLMRCHVRAADGRTLAFYGQVGDGDLDHAYWGRAEAMTMARPSFKIDAAHPGSDLAAETAAALAATALVFQADEPAYAARLLDHARALYEFADAYRGDYSDSIPAAAAFYRSWSGHQDELVWGALWLHRATGEPGFLVRAKLAYQALSPGGAGNHPYGWGLSWDDKKFGCYILLAQLDGGAPYRADAERWLDYWTVGVNGQRVATTPGGLAWLDRWGALRYAANTAFCAFVYADRVADPDSRYSSFARRQIRYALGDNPAGRSYVCGFGQNPPSRPHHRGAHASLTNDINAPAENRHVLFGALVGGPDANDAYADLRTDYVQNEVALDYNAAFTGALARLYLDDGGFTPGETSPAPAPRTLLLTTFDDFPLGPQTDASWLARWPGTSLANGPEEGRVAVDDAVAYGGAGRAVRVLYPRGGKQSSGSGAQWFADLLGESDELYFSYWVRFDPDFDFVLGGKLPGLGGAVSFADRTHEWSGRLMWREEGKAEFYLHTPAANDYNPGTRFWWNTEGFQARFIPGRWHHVEMHYRLNTPGQFDGLMEGWFDGVKAASYPAFYFRDAPTASARIAWVFFSTFFGGSSGPQWEALKDEHANFDQLIVSTARIGYPGAPADVDANTLPDAWEIAAFGSLANRSATADPDGDGQDNRAEYVAGHDPADARDRFSTALTPLLGGGLRVEADGRAGRRYRLQRSVDLRDWTTVTEVPALPADRLLRFDEPAAAPRVFYRVEVALP